jgi:hypothetical protein
MRFRNCFVRHWDAGCVFKLVRCGKQSNDDVLEKCTSQVPRTPGGSISSMTALLLRDFKNAVSAPDPINGITVAVPNTADAAAFEQQVSSTLVNFCRANPSRHKMLGLRVCKLLLSLSHRQRLLGSRSCILGSSNSVIGTTS